MSETITAQIISSLRADGRLTVELRETTLPAPSGHEVLLRVQAAPINPSDLGMIFGPADLAHAQFSAGRIECQLPDAATRAMAGRVGLSLPAGIEGAGSVVAAGDAVEALALLGKRVACAPSGGMYAQYCLCDARQCMVLPEGVTAEQGASSYVNPLTALGFIETARRDGHAALVHTVAASNLGQMLVRLCHAERVALVNVVRSQAQVSLLKRLGAQWIIDCSRDSFEADLAAALEATQATLVFDPIGGGSLVSRILTVMERIASAHEPYSRYGSSRRKQVYLYGSLDPSPTMLARTFGYSWSVGGWLMTPFLDSMGTGGADRLRRRVSENLTTLFASHYTARVSLQDALKREIALGYMAKRTGEKYLITPS